jgi:prepilin-type N-terminal cleavage/methylation domain-containing protein
VSKRNQRGFTLLEIAIVLAIIVVLSAVILAGQGFIGTSRVSSGARFVDTIRQASQGFAKRQNLGASFVGLSRDALVANNLISDTTQTPWGQTDFIVGPNEDNDFVEIVLCVPQTDCAALSDLVRPTSQAVNCVDSAACADWEEGTQRFSAVTR